MAEFKGAPPEFYTYDHRRLYCFWQASVQLATPSIKAWTMRLWNPFGSSSWCQGGGPFEAAGLREAPPGTDDDDEPGREHAAPRRVDAENIHVGSA